MTNDYPRNISVRKVPLTEDIWSQIIGNMLDLRGLPAPRFSGLLRSADSLTVHLSLGWQGLIKYRSGTQQYIVWMQTNALSPESVGDINAPDRIRAVLPYCQAMIDQMAKQIEMARKGFLIPSVYMGWEQPRKCRAIEGIMIESFYSEVNLYSLDNIKEVRKKRHAKNQRIIL